MEKTIYYENDKKEEMSTRMKDFMDKISRDEYNNLSKEQTKLDNKIKQLQLQIEENEFHQKTIVRKNITNLQHIICANCYYIIYTKNKDIGKYIQDNEDIDTINEILLRKLGPFSECDECRYSD